MIDEPNRQRPALHRLALHRLALHRRICEIIEARVIFHILESYFCSSPHPQTGLRPIPNLTLYV